MSTTLQHPDRVVVGHGVRFRVSEITPDVEDRARVLAARTLNKAAERGLEHDPDKVFGAAVAVIIKCDRRNQLLEKMRAEPPAPGAGPKIIAQAPARVRSRRRERRPGTTRRRSSARSGDSPDDPEPPGANWRWATPTDWAGVR